MYFDIVFTCDEAGGIGKNNTIPWIIKEEIDYFKKLTKNTLYICNENNIINTINSCNDNLNKNTVIIGKNTFLNIGQCLKDRINIIITSKEVKDFTCYNIKNPYMDELYYVKTLDEALIMCKTLKIKHIFIIGGLTLYKEALNNNNLRYIYITRIKKHYNCDDYLEIDYEQFTVIDLQEKELYDIKLQINVIVQFIILQKTFLEKV